jgi:hypothetical protein
MCVRCPEVWRPDPNEPHKDNSEMHDQCNSYWDTKAT